MSKRVLLCGVGGQGTILAAHILADAAMSSGLDVKVSEIHGMAQRGGSVTTVVTFGEEVHSMVSGTGQSDYLVSFDKLEALRNLGDLKLGGPLIVSDSLIVPQSGLNRPSGKPLDFDHELESAGAVLIPAEAIAKEAGSIKASNIVMLGALSKSLDFDDETWTAKIRDKVPPKTVDVNIEAFLAGRTFAVEHS